MKHIATRSILVFLCGLAGMAAAQDRDSVGKSGGDCTAAQRCNMPGSSESCPTCCLPDPQPVQMEAARNLSLSGMDWRIHEDADGSGAERRLFEADLSSAGWIPATVPGNVQADLEAAHLLKPLWYGAGDPRLAEVAQKDWWYGKDLEAPAAFAGKRLTLVFDGVDHQCEVWLNGTRLGHNAGMFRRFQFDVTETVRPGRMNRLAVRIARIPQELIAVMASSDAKGGANVGAAINATRLRLKELKSPTNCAWDWAVAVWTLGIWKDVRLEATGPARIEWVRAQTPLADDYRRGTVRVQLDVDSAEDMAARAVFRVRRLNESEIRATRCVDVALKKGPNEVQGELVLENPALWWPSGQGDQPLYELESMLVAEDHAAGSATGPLDRRLTRFGVREIRWEQCPGVPPDFINPLKLVVNGRPVRQMGSNILPPDCLFGRMNRRGPRLFELAEAAGINCLRVWGGGVVFSEAMFDRADELGIMLLEEFPLANNLPETDAVMLSNLESTITNIIQQTRNHPCIVEWTGGNEMPWRNGDKHPALQLLERIVDQEDGRIFRATEPAQGSGPHGTYTYVYHTGPAPQLSWLGAGSKTLYQRYNTAVQMRISEFGTNSPANLEVWQREIPPASRWPLENLEDEILIRKNVFHGALLPRNWLHKELTERVFGKCDGLPSLVEAGQFLGAEGLRYAMDALRRKGPALGGGFMSWNYNEPWPNGAGSYMIDYDGRPLMNYDFVRQALAPVALSLQYDSLLFAAADGLKAELFLTSDAPGRVENVQWSWTARDRRGTAFARGKGTATIEPLEVKSLGALELKLPPKTAFGPLLVELQLADAAGKRLTERLHVFGLDGVAAPLAGLLRNRRADCDDTPQSMASIESADGPANLALVGTGTKPARDGRPESWRPVRRTMLRVHALPSRVEGDQEVLQLQVTNSGAMTALFCEAHPLIVYRTDLFVENNHCFIPPGESRTITIRATAASPLSPAGEGAASKAHDLSLGETGWRISCWNADEAVVEPGAEVLLAVARRDRMCREFLGYRDTHRIQDVKQTTLRGTRPDPSPLPHLLDSERLARFEFPLSEAQAKRPARLRIDAADQSRDVRAVVEVSVNGKSFEQSLPAGLGFQKTDPAHLAFPATAVFEIPINALQREKNILEIRVDNGGWFTWDAMHLASDD